METDKIKRPLFINLLSALDLIAGSIIAITLAILVVVGIYWALHQEFSLAVIWPGAMFSFLIIVLIKPASRLWHYTIGTLLCAIYTAVKYRGVL